MNGLVALALVKLIVSLFFKRNFIDIGELDERDYIVGLYDGNCRIYNKDNTLNINELIHKDQITDIAYCLIYNNDFVATSSLDQTLHLYKVNSYKSLLEINCIGT